MTPGGSVCATIAAPPPQKKTPKKQQKKPQRMPQENQGNISNKLSYIRLFQHSCFRLLYIHN